MERVRIAEATQSPWDPNLRLAKIFEKKNPGLRIQKEPLLDQEPPIEGRLVLTIDPSQSRTIEGWQTIADTKDFLMLEHATNGEVDFFEGEIEPEGTLIAKNYDGFNRFYDFTRALAFDRAIENAMQTEDYSYAKELRLRARKGWVPTLRGFKKTLATYYVNSILDRVYNLITTGEENASFFDRILDTVY